MFKMFKHAGRISFYFVLFVVGFCLGVVGFCLGKIYKKIELKLNKSKSFTVYLLTNKTKMENMRLYYNGTNFQSVLAEDYTKEELEKEFGVMRFNVKLAKALFHITADTIELKTANGSNTLCKCIYTTNKNGDYHILFFRTPQDYDAFLKQIF